MKVDEFAFGFLKNIWLSREKKKVPFLGVIMMISVLNGKTRRRSILADTKINYASFYSTLNSLVSLGYVIHHKAHYSNGQGSLVHLTDKGRRYLRYLFNVVREGGNHDE